MSRQTRNQVALLDALDEVRRYRQERDDALKAVEQLQRHLSESQALLDVGTWRRAIDSDHLIWSEQTYRIHGIPPGSLIDRNTAIGLVHENDRKRVRTEFESALREQRPFRIIYRIKRPDGQVRMLHADNMVSTDAEGSTTMIYGAVHDITDTPLPVSLQRAEGGSNSESCLIVDQAGIMMRHSGSFVPWVRHLEAGSSVFRLLKTEESHEILVQAMDAVETDMTPRRLVLELEQAGEPRHFELRPWTPFGDWWGFVLAEAEAGAEMEAGPHPDVFDPASLGALSSAEESSGNGRGFVPASDSPLLVAAWERDMERDEVVWSLSLYDIVERRPEDGPMTRDEFLEIVHPEDRDAYQKALEKLDRTKLPVRHQFRICLPSGNVKTLQGHAEFLNRTQVYSHVLGTLTDISKTTDLQDAIRVSDLKERGLRNMLAASHQELIMASLRLQTAQERERLRIATELHDEAGGLLTALNLTLNELKQTAPSNVLERAEDLLDRLTEQIRDTSRKLRPSVLDQFGLVHGLEQLAEDMAVLGDWDLELDLPSTDPFIEEEITDALFGIAREALLNTLKHAEARNVRLFLHRRADGILLSVRDDGLGLSENMHPDVSTGLGLASLRDRAETLGGYLHIHSPADGGTQIAAFIPTPSE